MGPEAPLDLDVHPIPGRGGEPDHQHFDVRFLLRARCGRLAPGSGVKAARWVPRERALLLDPEPAMARVARKIAAAGRVD